MKIKLLVKKIKHKIIKFLYEYFKRIYIRNINICLEDVTPKLEKKAFEEIENNK